MNTDILTPKPIICAYADDWGETNINVDQEKHLFYWRVSPFSSHERCATNEKRESPVVFGLNNNKCRWKLLLCTNAENETDKRCLSVYLVFESCDDDNFTEIELSEVQFIIRNSELTYLSSKTLRNEKLKVGQSLGVQIWFKQVPRIIMIECRLSRIITVNVDNKTRQSLPLEKQVITYLLPDKFKHLIGPDDYFDITLICRSQEFMAHTAVLAARSPLFLSVLQQRIIRERLEDRVYLPYIAPEVLKELLHFIYTDEVPKIEIMPRELLAIAENYGLKDLKYRCELVLLRKLTIYNVCDTLCFAEINNAKELKTEAEKFARIFAKEIAGTNRAEA